MPLILDDCLDELWRQDLCFERKLLAQFAGEDFFFERKVRRESLLCVISSSAIPPGALELSHVSAPQG